MLDLGWTLTWQLSVLIVLAGLLTRLLGKRAPALVSGLWLVVMIKALTPPLWASATGLFSWAQVTSTTSNVGSTPTRSDIAVLQAGGLWEAAGVGILIVWAAGSAFSLLVAMARGWRLRRILRAGTRADDDPLTRFVREIKTELSMRGGVRVVVSPEGLGPAVCGVTRTTVILPASLADEDDRELLRPLIIHELLHAKRGDTFVAMLQTVVTAFWWFHPLVWWAARESNRVVERCVDRAVVGCLDSRPAHYARGMLRVLEMQSRVTHPTGLAGLCSAPLTEERLRELFGPRPSTGPARRAVGRAARVVFLAAAVVIALPGSELRAFESKPTDAGPRCTYVSTDVSPESGSPTDSRSVLPTNVDHRLDPAEAGR
ncbi:MAG: M56 family metallopeptidase [Planctomycetota bacterium]